MTSGIAFIVASLIGGFVSSIGTDIYHELKKVIANGSQIPLSLPQIVFLLIGIAGIGLLISSLIEDDDESGGPLRGRLQPRKGGTSGSFQVKLGDRSRTKISKRINAK